MERMFARASNGSSCLWSNHRLTHSSLPDIVDIQIHISTLLVHSLEGMERVITQTAEYALRAIVYLAEQELPCTTQQIAEQTQVPAGYLSKVMQSLSRAGLVDSQRGIHGGFVLSVSADQLSVLTVINAVEPIRRFHKCPLGKHGTNLCPLHRKLDDAAKHLEECFGGTTVSELNEVPKQRKPFCAFPMSSS